MSCFITTNMTVVCSGVSFKLSSGFMPTNDETLCQTAFVATDAARIVPDNNKDNNGSVATNMAGKCPDVSFKNIKWRHAYKCANAVVDSGLSLGSCLDVWSKLFGFVVANTAGKWYNIFLNLSSGFMPTNVRTPSRTAVSGLAALLTSS